MSLLNNTIQRRISGIATCIKYQVTQELKSTALDLFFRFNFINQLK